MLDVRRLQVLRAVVSSGSVSAAATNLGYTPSAISQQLSTLEREAGLPLLEKAGRGVRPTPAGTLLADRAGQVAQLLGDTEAELVDLRTGRTGLLRLRFFQTASVALIPPAVAEFRSRHPDVQLDLRTQESGSFQAVAEAAADIAILVVSREVPAAPGVRTLPLADEPYFLVLPPDHPLGERERVDLTSLSGESWVVESNAPGPCSESLADAYACAGITPRVALEAEESYAVQGFVAAGLGVALLPRLGLNVVHPGVLIRPVQHPQPVRRLYVAVRETVADQPAARELLHILSEVVHGAVTADQRP